VRNIKEYLSDHGIKIRMLNEECISFSGKKKIWNKTSLQGCRRPDL
jgi:hypothetical protein